MTVRTNIGGFEHFSLLWSSSYMWFLSFAALIKEGICFHRETACIVVPSCAVRRALMAGLLCSKGLANSKSLSPLFFSVFYVSIKKKVSLHVARVDIRLTYLSEETQSVVSFLIVLRIIWFFSPIFVMCAYTRDLLVSWDVMCLSIWCPSVLMLSSLSKG